VQIGFVDFVKIASALPGSVKIA